MTSHLVMKSNPDDLHLFVEHKDTTYCLEYAIRENGNVEFTDLWNYEESDSDIPVAVIKYVRYMDKKELK